MDLVAFLRHRYKYDPETGVFTHPRDGRVKTRKGSVTKAGDRADFELGNGYRALSGPPGKQDIQAHRAAWAMTHGAFPAAPLVIDHINRHTDDNRIANLRVVTQSFNAFHSKRPATSSGFRGVTWHKGASKWASSIRVDGQKKHLGYFNSKSEAAVAYARAVQRYYNTSADVLTIALSDSPLDGHR